MRIDITHETADINEINMTPFIDIMLVLLIVFMITLPVIQHATQVELPQASNQESTPQTDDVRLSILADGSYLWNEEPADAERLAQLLAAAALTTPDQRPTLLLYADRQSRYEALAGALTQAQRNGLTKISFVTEPAAP